MEGWRKLIVTLAVVGLAIAFPGRMPEHVVLMAVGSFFGANAWEYFTRMKRP